MDRSVALVCEELCRQNWLPSLRGFEVINQTEENLMPDEEGDGYYSVLTVRNTADRRVYKAHVRLTDQGPITCVSVVEL